MFQNSSNIALPSQSILLESEYWFYDEAEVSGIPRQPNIPGPDSNDWEEVFAIPVEADAQNNLSDLLAVMKKFDLQ